MFDGTLRKLDLEEEKIKISKEYDLKIKNIIEEEKKESAKRE
jgi:hypothetical protein